MAKDELEHQASKRRFAMVVIVKAEDAMTARRELSTSLAGDDRCIDVGAPCPVGPAQAYETIEIHLMADEETAVTVPSSPLTIKS